MVNSMLTSFVFALLQSRTFDPASPRFFSSICHSYENTGGVPKRFPNRESLSVRPLVNAILSSLFHSLFKERKTTRPFSVTCALLPKNHPGVPSRLTPSADPRLPTANFGLFHFSTAPFRYMDNSCPRSYPISTPSRLRGAFR